MTSVVSTTDVKGVQLPMSHNGDQEPDATIQLWKFVREDRNRHSWLIFLWNWIIFKFGLRHTLCQTKQLPLLLRPLSKIGYHALKSHRKYTLISAEALTQHYFKMSSRFLTLGRLERH